MMRLNKKFIYLSQQKSTLRIHPPMTQPDIESLKADLAIVHLSSSFLLCLKFFLPLQGSFVKNLNPNPKVNSYFSFEKSITFLKTRKRGSNKVEAKYTSIFTVGDGAWT